MRFLSAVSICGVLLVAGCGDGGAVPDGAMPDLGPPDARTPDLPQPDLPAPDMPVPDMPVPDMPVPDLLVPDMLVPDLLVPDLLVPDLPVPDLPVPDLSVPDLPVPDLAVPDHAVPDQAQLDMPPGGPCGGGKLLSAKVYPSSYSFGDDAWAYKMVVHGDGSIVVVGRYQTRILFAKGTPKETYLVANGYQATSPFYAKFTAKGDFVWARGPLTKGGAYGVAAMADGSTIIAGTFTSMVTFDKGLPTEQTLQATGGYYDDDGYLARVDKDGKLVWVRRIGSPGNSGAGLLYSDGKNAISVSSGFYGSVTAGDKPPKIGLSAVAPGGQQDAFMALYDGSGKPVWLMVMGGQGTRDRFMGRVILSNGDMLVPGIITNNGSISGWPAAKTPVGHKDGTGFIARIKPSGTIDWIKPVGTTNMSGMQWALQHSASAFSVFGYASKGEVLGTSSGVAHKMPAYGRFLATFSNSGDIQAVNWVGNFMAQDIVLAPAGCMMVGGYINNTGEFSVPGGSKTINATASGREYFLSCMTPGPHLGWIRMNRDAHPRFMARAKNGDLLVLGSLRPTGAVLAPGTPSSLTLKGTGDWGFYLARYSP